MTRILVTGAAGFIGSHLCEFLLERGCEVRGLDAFTSFYAPLRKQLNVAPLLRNPAFEMVRADLLGVDLEGALHGVDAIAHLAGEPGVSTSWGNDFERYLVRNVLATQRLLEAASATGVERFVYASSSSVYGADVDAARGRREPRPASPYGVSKLAAETLVGAYAGCHGLPTVSLRYFSVYGPRQRPDMAAHRFIEALLDNQPLKIFGDGEQVRDFTYVGDVVEATARAIFSELPPATVLDIASSNPVSVATLVRELGYLTGAEKVSVEQHDDRPGDVPRTEGRIAPAREHLGWSPSTDLRTGLTAQIAWHTGLRGAERQDEHRRERHDDQTLLPAAGQS